MQDTFPISAAHPRVSDWHAACRADGLTAVSLRCAAVYIWHTCFGLCRLAIQMAGRGVVFLFLPQFLMKEEPTTVVSYQRD